MTLTVGNKAVYPSHGPCRINRIVNKVIDGKPTNFYHLLVLDDSAGELFVPVDKARAIGLRLLLKRSEIPKLLLQLSKSTNTANTWKERAADNSRRFNSGSALDLAKVVGSLTKLKDTKSLTLSEARTLEKARKLLVCEISEVMGETKDQIEEQIDRALSARTSQTEDIPTEE